MSVFDSFNSTGVGIDISDLSFKLMQLSPSSGDSFSLRAWNAVDIKPGIIEEGLIIDRPKVVAALKELKESVHGSLTSTFVVASLPETKTFVKLFRIEKHSLGSEKKQEKKKKHKVSEDAALIEAVERELPKEIPLSLENILYDYQVVQETTSHWEVLVGAAPRDVVLEYTSILKDAGYHPMALEIEAQAIGRALIGKSPRMSQKHIKKSFKFDVRALLKKKPKQNVLPINKAPAPNTTQVDIKDSNDVLALLIDIGATRSSMIVYHHCSIQLTRSLRLSGNDLSAAVATKMNLAPAKAEQAKKVCGLDPKKCKGEAFPVMQEWLGTLVQEINETMNYYTNEKEGTTATFDKIILCGGGAALLGLPEQLEAAVGVTVENFDATAILQLHKGLPELPQKSLPGYATVIGLAMRDI